MGFGPFERIGRATLALSAVVLWTGCSGDSGAEHLGPVPIQKSTFKISPSTLDMDALADLGQFTATRTDGQGRPSNLNQFVWRSLSPDIAQVDGAGRVVSLGEGTATIEVTVSGQTARAAVVVDQVPVQLSVGPAADTLETINQERTLTLNARDRNGFRIPRRSFGWESDDPTIATVDDNGTVQGKKSGKTRVRVRKRGRNDETTITVNPVANSMTISPRRDTLKSIGATQQLRAYVNDAQGRAVADDGFSWTSSHPNVASVSSTGRVVAIGTGTTAVTASSGGLNATSTIVVTQAVDQVSISPATASLANEGLTVQLSASGMDQQGNAVSASSFTWSSDRPGVASVNAAGLVTGVAQGTARITATAPSGAKGFANVAVGSIQLHLAPTSATLQNVGDVTQLAIYPKDPSGAAASCPNPVWSSSNAQVASVNAQGRVTALAVGTAVIMVTACAIQESSSITVLGGGSGGGGSTPPPPPPPPPPPSGLVLPALPQSLPVTPNGQWSNTVYVPSGGNLQQAINQASAGTRILLAPGGTYNGAITLPARGDNGWVSIETDLSASTTTRVDSTLNLATITSSSNIATIRADAGADGWQLSLLDVTSSHTGPNAPIYLHAQSANVPDRIMIDRVYIHPGAGKYTRRCVLGNASNLTIRYSLLIGCRQPGAQTQGVSFWNTPGPIHIHDNHIQGAGQGIMSGGAGGVYNNPSDITVRRNHFYTPASWQGVYQQLAPIETKDVRRLLVEGNVIEGGDFAFLIKTSNQGGACGTNCGTLDVTVRNNRILNTRSGANLARDPVGGGIPMENVMFENNVFEKIGPDSQGWSGGQGRMFQVLTAPHNIIIRNNSILSRGHTYLYLAGTGSAITPLGTSLVVDNLHAQGPFAYRALVQSPAGISNHYASFQIGTIYGDCASPPGGGTCVASAPSGAGANITAVNSATAGVVR